MYCFMLCLRFLFFSLYWLECLFSLGSFPYRIIYVANAFFFFLLGVFFLLLVILLLIMMMIVVLLYRECNKFAIVNLFMFYLNFIEKNLIVFFCFWFEKKSPMNTIEKCIFLLLFCLFVCCYKWIYSMLSNSTSNVKAAFGGMTPGWPREP